MCISCPLDTYAATLSSTTCSACEVGQKAPTGSMGCNSEAALAAATAALQIEHDLLIQQRDLLDQQNQTCRNEKTKLELDIRTLQNNITILESHKLTLLQEKTKLESDTLILQGDKNSLIVERDTLETKIGSMEDQLILAGEHKQIMKDQITRLLLQSAYHNTSWLNEREILEQEQVNLLEKVDIAEAKATAAQEEIEKREGSSSVTGGSGSDDVNNKDVEGPTDNGSNDVNKNGGTSSSISCCDQSKADSLVITMLALFSAFLLCVVMLSCCCLWRKDMILNEIILQNVNGKGKGLTTTSESDLSYLSSSNPSFGQMEMSQVNIVMGGTNNVKRRESLKKKNVKKGRRMKAINDRKLKQNVDKVKKTFGQLQTKSSVDEDENSIAVVATGGTNPLYDVSSAVSTAVSSAVSTAVSTASKPMMGLHKKNGSFRKHQDEEGRNYYHCEVSNKVQWEKPEEHDMKVVEHDSIMDPESRRHFFVNKKTGHRTWTDHDA